MFQNMTILEAMYKPEAVKINTSDIVAEIKKVMNTCKLTKFKSESWCGQLYSLFFLSTLGDINPSVDQWSTIYTDLLSNNVFCEDLAKYMAIYRPSNFTGVFAPLWNKIQLELAEMKQNRVRYLSLTKGFITTLQSRMQGVTELIKLQVNDPETLKFANVVNMVLNQYVMDLGKMISEEVIKSADPDSLVIDSKIHGQRLSEDAIELIGYFQNADAIINEMCGFDLLAEMAALSSMEDDEDGPVNEGIVRNAVMKAKEIKIAAQKAERDFDQFVMRKIRKMREQRRNRKHSEMVGEALAINHEIKRLLKSGAWYLVNPSLGVLRFIIGIVYDKATDKKDRAVLVRQIREEMEILEEKIQMAERNGDDKARIELIRARQKLTKEYERITKMRFTTDRRVQNMNMG